ncbi:pyrimidine 5'-nucleotidase [Vibrio salinus]|uniref:pyrimidine 5'-nucleotidase n=1 Tax=Vibrio salinus TaxID=2899784 RepID=UPI001E595A94|nr:pyrimidine 5'-nucleotidase [Vibrio salinus]MCE0494495.1 pyrimidine 5'-nucleotidase [Vibrio salinus]
MQYDWVLFDADETLFHFGSYTGIKLMLERKGVELTDDSFRDYEKVNKPLWVHYQNGDITASELKTRRFKIWAEQLNTTPQELNYSYMQAMGDICTLLPGARELIEKLSQKVKLGIITNGFSDLQSIRLEQTGLAPYFEHVIISEEIGIAKPDRRIFEHALTLMGNPDKSRVLMVGDNPHSDILGGLNTGIDTCWLNTEKVPSPDGVNAHMEVSSLDELHQYLLA